MSRRCSSCGQNKSDEEMVADNGRAHRLGWQAGECKACKRRRREATYSPEQQRSHELKSRYGITSAEYERIRDAQGGVCAICKQPPRRGRLHVDHDHLTGQVRGLLCARCNSAIDWSLEFAEQARAYLADPPCGYQSQPPLFEGRLHA